jgi:hypothetical protein
MGVPLAWPAMCRPTRVPDADRAKQRMVRELCFKVLDLAFSAQPLEPA